MQKHARIRQERRRRHRFSFRSFHASASVVRRSSNVSLSFSFARDLCRDDDNKVVCSFVRDDDEAIALDIGRDIFSSKAEETRESSLTTRRSSQLVEYVCTRLSFFFVVFFCMGRFPVFSPILPIFVHLFCIFFFVSSSKKISVRVTNERTNETYIKRKKEKNNKKNDRLRSGDRTRAYSGHSREFRDDERDEEEIGRLARMGERFKGTSSSSSSSSFFFCQSSLFKKSRASKRRDDG